MFRVIACAALLALVSTPSMAQDYSSVGGGVLLRLLRDDRLGPNRVAVLESDLAYCYPPTRELIIVPAGYVTDFASVPSLATVVVERYGTSIEAAIVHDWLYAVGEPGRRRWADEIFRYALGERGVNWFSRNLARLGVRAGGTEAYGRDGEWYGRFYFDGQVGRPRFAKPSTAVVAVIRSCDDLENETHLQWLIQTYGSDTWPEIE